MRRPGSRLLAAPPRLPSKAEPSIDRDDLSRDESRSLRAKEGDRRGHLLRRRRAPDRRLLDELGHHLIAERAGREICAHIAGCDRVARDVARAILAGDRLGEPDQPRLGGGIVVLAAVAGWADAG